MNDFEHLHDEEAEVLSLLGTGAPLGAAALTDDLHLRLLQAMGDPRASDLDLAVLLRQLLRRWSLRDGHPATVALSGALSARVAQVSGRVALRNDGDRWSALPWRPSWLVPSEGWQGTLPDEASVAGTSKGRRFKDDPLVADPFFEEATAFPTYRTPGQRAACRAVVSTAPGSCIVAMLPTGSGKTEVALALAKSRQQALTLLVVPTVALAYDFERRLRDHYGRGRDASFDVSSLKFAWTATTDEETRTQLRDRVREGRQPILVTSPESVSRALRHTLLEAAGAGRLTGVVIDEAHLVTQWGRDFRPEFRTLALLVDELSARAAGPGHQQPKVLLLSATLGSRELLDLHMLFGQHRHCTLIAANALRPEPEMWVSSSPDDEERRRRVVEALDRLPRPAVLYVTSPETAEKWRTSLRSAGFGRIAVVTGRSSGTDRSKVLAGIRTDGSDGSTIDLVVATSAFGLGIDYPHIRTVVHAALPETVDRWYQEIGRGGRDGDASAAVLLTAPADRREAESLATTVIKPETARRRWGDLWSYKRDIGGRSFVDLEGARGSIERGSYNRKWNAQLLQGLVELGALKRSFADLEDLEFLNDGQNDHEWTAVDLQRADLDASDFWQEKWAPWQAEEVRASRAALQDMSRMLSGDVSCCSVVASTYAASSEVMSVFGRAAVGTEPSFPCGRCPKCRNDGLQQVTDPPPRPAQRWLAGTPTSNGLQELAQASGARDGLVLLVAEHVDEAAQQLLAPLLRAGVRHVSGWRGTLPRSTAPLFLDGDVIGPADLTPLPAFVIQNPSSNPSHHWLNRRLRFQNRPASGAVDVLLLSRHVAIGDSRVGRDLPALEAETALEILGG